MTYEESRIAERRATEEARAKGYRQGAAAWCDPEANVIAGIAGTADTYRQIAELYPAYVHSHGFHAGILAMLIGVSLLPTEN